MDQKHPPLPPALQIVAIGTALAAVVPYLAAAALVNALQSKKKGA